MTVNGFEKSNPSQAMIEQALCAQRFAHTCIIEGASYDERIALAEKIGAALLCEDPEQRPCGKCSHCIKTKHGLHPDFLIYLPRTEKQNKNPGYAINYISEIRDEVFIIPNEADKKIIVFSNAEMLSDRVQNALLKILEEPPEYAYFILLTVSKSVFLETILSRASVYNIGESEGVEDDEISADDAIEAAEKTATALLADNHFEIVTAAGVFDKNPKLLKAALCELQKIFSDALRIKFKAQAQTDSTVSAELSSKFTKNALLRMVDATNELLNTFNYNANYNLTSARLCSVLKSAITEQE